jgi:hypothetical protein
MPDAAARPILIRPLAIALLLAILRFFPAAAPQAQAAPATASLAARQTGQHVAAAPETGAPESLAVWKDWVLRDDPEAACPSVGNDPATRQCAFPTRLTLSLDESGASFALTVTVFAETAVTLPHTPRSWPEDVRDGGLPLPVTASGDAPGPSPTGRPAAPAALSAPAGAPRATLAPGEHHITGRLRFSGLPGAFTVDVGTGLAEMTRGGAAVPFDLSADGQLRPRAARAEKKDGDALSVTVMRLVRDGSPLTVTTLARLDVTGMARRLTLDRLLPEGGLPLAVKSPLPVTFGPDGTVFVQAGPGRFDVELTSRLPGRVTSIGPAVCPFGPETWAFAPAPDLREVEITGAMAVDPRNTDLPGTWKGFSAFAVPAGTVLSLAETHRGEPPAGPDAIHLSRVLWLDFAGRGATVRDRLTGEMRRQNTLTMPPPAELGRVTLSGRDAPVVLLRPGAGPENAPPVPGVVLPGSRLDMTAESRLADFSGAFAAVGFDADVASLSAELRLPPGWTVLSGHGPDDVSPTFVGRFTLLDLFLILLAGLAAAKLGGAWAGLCVLSFAALSMYEQQAPGGTWIFLLAALALARLARAEGVAARVPWFARLTRLVRLLAWLAMLAAAAVFVPTQLRHGMYPQLSRPDQAFAPVADTAPAMLAGAARNKAVSQETAAPQVMEGMDAAEMGAPPPPPSPQAAPKAARSGKPAPAAPPAAALAAKPAPGGGGVTLDYDPEALIQTGPGIPDWSFNTVRLSFDGPVSRTQTVRLWLIPPWANLLLAFVRCGLLLGALFLLARRDRAVTPPVAAAGPAASTAPAAAALFLALLAAGAAAPAAASDFPPQELLDEYRSRLTEPAACFPGCLGSPLADVTVRDGRLTVMLRADAAARTTAPLPRVSGGGFYPDAVTIDDVPARELVRRGDETHLLLPPGTHRVVMSGALPAADSFSVEWPLVPHRLTVTAPGFQVRGLGADGVPERAVRLDRVKADAASGQPAGQDPGATARIPAFAQITRTITMGLEWTIVTEAVRQSPPGEAVVMEIALAPGESVLDETVKTEGGKAIFTLAPDQQRLSWRSRLAVAPALTLTAPENAPYVETWVLAVSPIWEATASGIPPSRTFGPSGERRPVFRPWPGESLTLAVTRPGPAPGETLTIDSARLHTAQGDRLAESSLALRLRAARGLRHALAIPADATQIKLTVDGRETAYGSDPGAPAAPGRLEFPLKPGSHEVLVTWRQDTPLGVFAASPAVDLMHGAVNVQVEMELPRDRWTLFVHGDTPLSPVVGFWSHLAFFLAAALILGSFPATPLSRRQWFLLALGLSQISSPEAMLAAAWLFALGLRQSYAPKDGWFAFNAMQVGLAALTAIGLYCLYTAIERGLLGDPLMQVAGNGSTARLLRMTFDRVAGAVPQATVISAPIIVYRLAMLAWSLWMALALLSWLKWGVARFTEGGGWRRAVVRLPRFSRRPLPDEDTKPPAPGAGQP